MIASIQGILRGIESNSLLIEPTVGDQPAGIVYQVLVPAYTAARMGDRIDRRVSLLTTHFVESQGQGTTLIPRLAGFTTADDRRFYELFTTCKGVGPKRALRAMALGTPQIAMAIADRDAAILQSLPEIGRRMAETIIATLSGKVDPFLTPTSPAPKPESSSSSKDAGPSSASSKGTPTEDSADSATSVPAAGSIVSETLSLLVQLGENRTQALLWIDQVMRQKKRPNNTQEILAAVYRIKNQT